MFVCATIHRFVPQPRYTISFHSGITCSPGIGRHALMICPCDRRHVRSPATRGRCAAFFSLCVESVQSRTRSGRAIHRQFAQVSMNQSAFPWSVSLFVINAKPSSSTPLWPYPLRNHRATRDQFPPTLDSSRAFSSNASISRLTVILFVLTCNTGQLRCNREHYSTLGIEGFPGIQYLTAPTRTVRVAQWRSTSARTAAISSAL